MKLLKILGTVRKVLTKITDFLIGGRQRGLWQEGQGPQIKPVTKDEPR